MLTYLPISATTWELYSSNWPLDVQCCYSSKELLLSTEIYFNIRQDVPTRWNQGWIFVQKHLKISFLKSGYSETVLINQHIFSASFWSKTVYHKSNETVYSLIWILKLSVLKRTGKRVFIHPCLEQHFSHVWEICAPEASTSGDARQPRLQQPPQITSKNQGTGLACHG